MVYTTKLSSLITLLQRAMSILREEIVINFQPYPTTNVRCPVAACSFIAEHLYDGDLGNLNRSTDFAVRIIEMYLIRNRVLGDLESGAGHDLGEGETYGPPPTPGDTAQHQDSTGLQDLRASPVVLMMTKKKEYISRKSN